jgi:hypothetical protein
MATAGCPPEQLSGVEAGLVQVGGSVADAEGQPAPVVDLHQHPEAYDGPGRVVGDRAPEVGNIGVGEHLLGGVATHACTVQQRQQQQQQRKRHLSANTYDVPGLSHDSR